MPGLLAKPQIHSGVPKERGVIPIGIDGLTLSGARSIALPSRHQALWSSGATTKPNWALPHNDVVAD
ncbi:MAG: hypothetical protein OHK0015_54500 [Chloroflexi bacterium OHK40]